MFLPSMTKRRHLHGMAEETARVPLGPFTKQRSLCRPGFLHDFVEYEGVHVKPQIIGLFRTRV